MSDNVHDPETQDVTELDATDLDATELDGAVDADADETIVTARVYEISEPAVVHEPEAEPVDAAPVDVAPVDAAPEPEPVAPAIDLDRIERDLEGVEAALRRLDEGTYWTDEITGDPLDEALLVADPVARRNVA